MHICVCILCVFVWPLPLFFFPKKYFYYFKLLWPHKDRMMHTLCYNMIVKPHRCALTLKKNVITVPVYSCEALHLLLESLRPTSKPLIWTWSAVFGWYWLIDEYVCEMWWRYRPHNNTKKPDNPTTPVNKSLARKGRMNLWLMEGQQSTVTCWAVKQGRLFRLYYHYYSF